MNKFLQLDNKTLFVVALLSADFLLGLRKKVTSEYITKDCIYFAQIIESESKIKINCAEVKIEKAALLTLLRPLLVQYAGLQDKEDTGEIEAAIRVSFPVAFKEKEDKIQVILKCIKDSLQKWKKITGQSTLAALPDQIVETSCDGLKWNVEFVTNLLSESTNTPQQLRVVVQIGRVLWDGDVKPQRLELSAQQFESFRKDVKQAVGYL